MKLFIPLMFVSLFLLGCEEIVEVEKLVYDTVYVDKVRTLAESVIVLHDTTVIRDTVKVNIVIQETDTVFQVVTRDSVIIKRDTVFITTHDTVTIYDRTVMYLDTLYVTYDMWPTTSMPEEIAPLYADFNEIAFNHGKPPLSGHIIIQYVQQSELPGENWNSNSFKFANNHIIYLNVNLPTEQQRAGMYRELNHLNYGKQYSNDANKVMSPIFDPARTITTQQINQMF